MALGILGSIIVGSIALGPSMRQQTGSGQSEAAASGVVSVITKITDICGRAVTRSTRSFHVRIDKRLLERASFASVNGADYKVRIKADSCYSWASITQHPQGQACLTACRNNFCSLVVSPAIVPSTGPFRVTVHAQDGSLLFEQVLKETPIIPRDFGLSAHFEEDEIQIRSDVTGGIAYLRFNNREEPQRIDLSTGFATVSVPDGASTFMIGVRSIEGRHDLITVYNGAVDRPSCQGLGKSRDTRS